MAIERLKSWTIDFHFRFRGCLVKWHVLQRAGGEGGGERGGGVEGGGGGEEGVGWWGKDKCYAKYNDNFWIQVDFVDKKGKNKKKGSELNGRT